MKKIKLNQKLSLNKSVVSKLNNQESAVIVGGSSPTHCFCEKTKYKKDCCTHKKYCGVVDSVMKTCYKCEVVRTVAPFC